MFGDMKGDIFIFSLFAIIILAGTCDAEKPDGNFVNEEKFLESYEGLLKNIASLLKDEFKSLNIASESKDELLKNITERVARHQTLAAQTKNLSCPKALSNLTSLEYTILRKLLDDSVNYNEKINEILHNINCYGIKPADVEKMSMELEMDLQRYGNLLHKVENFKHQLEDSRTESNDVLRSGHEEFSKILAEINAKVIVQENKLDLLQMHTSSVEEARVSVAAKRQKEICMKCLQLKIVEQIKASEM